VEIPDLELSGWNLGLSAREVEKFTTAYLQFQTTFYDPTERGKHNTRRESFPWGESGGRVDLRGPETTWWSNKESVSLTFGAFYYAPGRPITAVDSAKAALCIRAGSSELLAHWPDPALLPFVDGLLEALAVEFPLAKPQIDKYARALDLRRPTLVTIAEAGCRTSATQYPPDPSQVEEAHRKSWQFWRGHVRLQLDTYAKPRGIDWVWCTKQLGWPKEPPIGKPPTQDDWADYLRDGQVFIDRQAGWQATAPVLRAFAGSLGVNFDALLADVLNTPPREVWYETTDSWNAYEKWAMEVMRARAGAAQAKPAPPDTTYPDAKPGPRSPADVSAEVAVTGADADAQRIDAESCIPERAPDAAQDALSQLKPPWLRKAIPMWNDNPGLRGQDIIITLELKGRDGGPLKPKTFYTHMSGAREAGVPVLRDSERKLLRKEHPKENP